MDISFTDGEGTTWTAVSTTKDGFLLAKNVDGWTRRFYLSDSKLVLLAHEATGVNYYDGEYDSDGRLKRDAPLAALATALAAKTV